MGIGSTGFEPERSVRFGGVRVSWRLGWDNGKPGAVRAPPTGRGRLSTLGLIKKEKGQKAKKAKSFFAGGAEQGDVCVEI